MSNEEAIKYLQQLYPQGGHCWLDEQRIEAINIAVKAIKALQQKQKDDQNESDMAVIAHMDGVEKGKQMMKEQMMKDAVDATLLENNMIRQKKTIHPLHVGDKVKIIIVKEN